MSSLFQQMIWFYSYTQFLKTNGNTFRSLFYSTKLYINELKLSIFELLSKSDSISCNKKTFFSQKNEGKCNLLTYAKREMMNMKFEKN